MSTVKKLLALVLALTMALSISAAAAYSVVPYGDADGIDADAEVAVEMLYNMGIMKGDDKGNFNPNATITRAEVAKMIYVVLNYGTDDKAVNYTGAKFFSDVEAGAWYEGYVNYAASIKLVQGRPDGTFGPNDPVTCAEAAKMLLTAIGYSAEARGYVGAGWDTQVLSDAAIIGLLDGYNYNTQTYAPRQWVAVMFKNALLDALTYDTIAPTTFNGLLTGNNVGTYTTMGDKYFGLYEWEGIIVANEYADLRDDDVLGAGRTKIDEVKKEFKNWTTDLTEIGEYRWGYAIDGGSRDEVVYVGGEDDNTVFSNSGAEVTSITTKSKIGGIKIDDNTKYFVNFEEVDAKSFNTVGNGDWLRVVHNDSDSTYAEYVFLTTFEMTEVDKIAKDDTVFLANDEDSDEFVITGDIAAGDIVLYNKIDDVEYVTLAENFTGKVDKYTYKTRVLTVAGEEYPQSDIAYASIAAAYYGDLEAAAKKTEYTYYMDFFGNIRIFSRSKADSGELVLLTDAYFETNRKGAEAAVDAYIDGAITEVEVDFDVDDTDVKNFIDDADHNNKWGVLKEFKDNAAWTNIARTSTDDEGVMSLYTAQTWKYNNKGEKTTVKADYIDLTEEDVKAGATTYNGQYEGKAVKVQATKNTLFYYVDEDLNIMAITGYKNSLDVVSAYLDTTDDADGINEMYAVATRVSSENTTTDADDDKLFWIADVIVIETEAPAFTLGDNVVLGYNVVNKTVSDYAYLDVIGADGAKDDLNVTNYNGYNSFKATEIEAPAFYFNTEDEEGDSHIRKITADWNKHGIYAETLNRVNKLDEYVVMADGDVLYYDEATIVYDMYTGTRYTAITAEDDYEDALELTTGESYIMFVNDDDVIVYAIWVEAYDDVAAELFNTISGATVGSLAKAKAEAKAAVDAWIKDYCVPTYAVTADDLGEALEEVYEAIDDAETAEAAAAIAYGKAPAAGGTGIIALDAKANELVAAEAAKATELTIAGSAALVNGSAVADGGKVAVKIGDVVTLTLTAEAVVTAEGATTAMGETMKVWTVTITAANPVVTIAK